MSRTSATVIGVSLVVVGALVAALAGNVIDTDDLGGLIAAVMGVALAAISIGLIERVESSLRRIRTAERTLPAPDTGVLICAAADEKTLASVARQLEVEALPTRSERKRTTGRSGSISFPIKVFKLGRSSSRSAEDTDVFENTDDTNVLLRRVLRVLDDTKALRRDLALS